MTAILLLEDGTVFKGKSFGAKGIRCGEVVFNTSMTGYQEITTDPSYHEQILTMTYPMIGNYGTNDVDWESRKAFCAGFIVKENCPYPSNYRDQQSFSDYLKEHGIVGLEGIDTRKLVKHIREQGAMRGVISSTEKSVPKLKKVLAEYPGLVGRDIVKDVTAKRRYKWEKGVVDVVKNTEDLPKTKYKVIAYDFGVKQNILRLLRSHGCDVEVVPAKTPAEKVLAKKPDGVFLSNGPGDPAPVLGKVPIFGICLGHQILSLAMGGKTYKLKFGHRGANHPVKNLDTGAIEITSQNHGFCADLDSFKGLDVEMTHLNLNDNTCEGIRSKKLKAFSVQYHPEASPGPHDSQYLFQQFIDWMGKKK
ncbi:MAG: glutamine-hydrolyzing carbamoyl-phosphate synthase small subunit [Planctomycetota bacterium]